MDTQTSSPRRYHSHRKKISVSRFSSDSVTPLPVYTSPYTGTDEDLPSDLPPDYPESSEEADADESDQDLPQSYAPLVSPRRARPPRLPPSARPAHLRHHQTQSDVYLDSLLARSVQALEASTTLLQSTMSTQSALSNLLSPDSEADQELDATTREAASKIKDNGDARETWMENIDEIGKTVADLFGDVMDDDVDNSESIPADETQAEAVSQSLPTTSTSPLAERRYRRRQTLQSPVAATPTPLPEPGQLGLSSHRRRDFISPAPRALTIYIGSNDINNDPAKLPLPSTLGIRNTPPSACVLRSSVLDPPRRPDSADTQKTTRASDILSMYVTPPVSTASRCPSASPSPSASRSTSKRRGSASVLERRSSSTGPIGGSPSRSSRDRTLTPLRAQQPTPLPRPMTPPLEELSSASNDSSGETQYAVQSLRKILDDQAQARLAQAAKNPSPSRPQYRTPSLLRKTPSLPLAGTSHATASVSRLLTKGKHTSSTRPGSPPRHSLLKAPSAPNSPGPSPSPSMLSIPNLFGSSSGRSTPNRVSFAELPESYAESKPEGSKFKERSKGKSKGKGKSTSEEYDGMPSGWLGSWLINGGVSGFREDKVEERVARWSMRPPGPGLGDDWTF